MSIVISKFKGLKNVGFNTFDQMNNSSVVHIIDYGFGIWGYKQNGDGDRIQFKAIRYFLGVYSKAPLLALEGDLGCTSSKTCHHINMIRLWNKFINMDESRIIQGVFTLVYQIGKNWSFEL